MNNINRIKELTDLLNQANKAYYQENREIMSNARYDLLYDELVKLEAETGIILASSPTQNVGYQVVNYLEEVAHNIPMLSLDKTKEEAKLIDFLGEHKGLLSYKLDGLTIVLTYNKGRLTQAVTRGTGFTGENITHNALHFKNLPKKIPYKERLVIRGEAVISYTDFELINQTVEEKYKNPRNLCSGAVRQLDSQISSKRKVKYYAFSVIESQRNFRLKSDTLTFLQELGFEIVLCKELTGAEIPGALAEFKDKLTELDLPCDGLVLTYDDIDFSFQLGNTSKFPKDSLAFKWEDKEAQTQLLDIEWNTSRTGLINPTAVFAPVNLEGTVVTKASLHNVSIVEDLQLGMGDTVTVYKANMIIPQIGENLTRSGGITPPDKCSVCGFPTIILQQKDAKQLYCTNKNCKAQILKSLTHYVSRNALNMEGLSEATLSKFLERGFIKNYGDLYELSKYSGEIRAMEGFGEKSLTKLLKSVEKSKKTTLERFIYGLGIPNVGLSNAKLLCNHYQNDIDKILAATKEDLESIEGFGEIIAASIIGYFESEENVALLKAILSRLEQVGTESNAKSSALKGLNFVVTGSLEKFENRKTLQEFIESLGGKVSSSVSKNTDFLINNDINSNSSKNKKAVELNVKIITEQELIDKYT